MPSKKRKTNINTIFNKLFLLIYDESSNENIILDFMHKHENIIKKHGLVNSLYDNEYQESLLMNAVWNLKKDVVLKLLSYGANVKYQSPQWDSVSTYFCLSDDNMTTEKQILICDIAEEIHNRGQKLNNGGIHNLSLVEKIMKMDDRYFSLVRDKLIELGYYMGSHKKTRSCKKIKSKNKLKLNKN